VTYEHDVAGGAEALLAVLRRANQLDDPERDEDRNQTEAG
jgi:hypothetical protein